MDFTGLYPIFYYSLIYSAILVIWMWSHIPFCKLPCMMFLWNFKILNYNHTVTYNFSLTVDFCIDHLVNKVKIMLFLHSNCLKKLFLTEEWDPFFVAIIVRWPGMHVHDSLAEGNWVFILIESLVTYSKYIKKFKTNKQTKPLVFLHIEEHY